MNLPPLAIDGGSPAVPDGPPDWPSKSDERIRAQLMAAWVDGSWGRYRARFGQQLVEKLRDIHGADHVLPCCSGTIAVELALRGVPVKPGDEVVLAAYDFPGNFRAVEAVGAKPVLVDIDPATWCLDAEQLNAAVSSTTSAVIVSHLHGGLADMQRITEVARDLGVAVVEDACQAPGSAVQDRMAGTWGDVGVLSFGGSKLLTAGRGGALMTSNPSVYQRAKIHNERGNDAFPLSELQAAVLIPQLESLDADNQRRRASVHMLQETWSELPIVRPVSAQSQAGLASYYKVALRYNKAASRGQSREQFIEALTAEGVSVGAGFRGFGRRGAKRCRSAGALSHAADAAETTVLLHHPALLMAQTEIAKIALAFRKVATQFT